MLYKCFALVAAAQCFLHHALFRPGARLEVKAGRRVGGDGAAEVGAENITLAGAVPYVSVPYVAAPYEVGMGAITTCLTGDELLEYRKMSLFGDYLARVIGVEQLL